MACWEFDGVTELCVLIAKIQSQTRRATKKSIRNKVKGDDENDSREERRFKEVKMIEDKAGTPCTNNDHKCICCIKLKSGRCQAITLMKNPEQESHKLK